MLSATTPFVTVVLSVAVLRSTYNKYVWLSMIPMCGGVILCIKGELNYDIVGVIATLTATVLRALKSIVSQTILNGENKLDAITTLYHTSGFSVPVLILGAYLKGESAFLQDQLVLKNPVMWTLLIGSSIMAFGLNLANFLVVRYTSAVTLQVLGNIKIVFAIAISLLIFGNEMSVMAVVGSLVTIGGAWMYNWAKKLKASEEEPTVSPRRPTI